MPLKVPAPVPFRPRPARGWPEPLVALISSVPWLGSSEPLEGETTLLRATDLRPPSQLTVEVIRT